MRAVGTWNFGGSVIGRTKGEVLGVGVRWIEKFRERDGREGLFVACGAIGGETEWFF